MTEAPVYDPFTRTSMFWGLISIILTIANIISDAMVARVLAQEFWWFTLTLLLILVPLLVINLFSIFWFHQVISLSGVE